MGQPAMHAIDCCADVNIFGVNMTVGKPWSGMDDLSLVILITNFNCN